MMIDFEKDKDITSLTTFGVKVKARYFVEYDSVRKLEKILQCPEYLDNNVMHIGGGSNLLFAEDYDGLIMHSGIKGIVEYEKDSDTHYVIAGAAEKWSDFVDWCIDHGYAGVENMAGIPGEVGAAPVQNVGAYGSEASDVIFAVEAYDVYEHKTVRLSREECRFAYRDSMFKKEGRGRYYVIRVSFLLKKSTFAETLDYGPLKDLSSELGHAPTTREVRDRVLQIRNSKLPDPAVTGSAGSFFTNPIVDRYYFNEEVRRRCSDVPFFDINERQVKVSAAWLIDHAGMKGQKCGGAVVWPGQCLVIANEGGATARDVMSLAKRVREKVSQAFGISLRPEVNIIDDSIEVTVLGTGTSKGVPEIGCRCRTCLSDDPKDKRLRTSVLLKTQGRNLLIDVSPDFRQQALIHGIDQVDAALFTHSHYDHVGGIDDLRPFCIDGSIPLFMKEDVEDDLRRRVDYCFRQQPYPGVPTFDIHRVDPDIPFHYQGIEIVPIAVNHGKLPIVGYRIGKFAYITDAKTIEPKEEDKLEDLDVLIVNALREREHFAHFSLQESLALIDRVKPRRAYLTHMNHENGPHAEIECKLPANVHYAYDGLVIKTR